MHYSFKKHFLNSKYTEGTMLGNEEARRGEDAQRRQGEYGSGAHGAYEQKTSCVQKLH